MQQLASLPQIPASLSFKAVHALIQLGKLEPYASTPAVKSVIYQGRVALFSAARETAPGVDEDGLALHTRLAAFVEDPIGTRKWPAAPGTLYPAHIRGKGPAWEHLWREARAAAVYGMPDAAMMLLDGQIQWNVLGGEQAREFTREKLHGLAARRFLRSKLAPAPSPVPSPAPVVSQSVSPVTQSGSPIADTTTPPAEAGVGAPTASSQAAAKKPRKPRKKKSDTPIVSSPEVASVEEVTSEIKH